MAKPARLHHLNSHVGLVRFLLLDGKRKAGVVQCPSGLQRLRQVRERPCKMRAPTPAGPIRGKTPCES